MGAVIKHWVLTKLGLPMPEYIDPSDLRRGLSNGYLLAEILRKYNYISDDQLIALGRNFSEKTRLKNMRYVERWMTESGFDVNFAELLDIVEEKPGAVIKFLYRLYFLLEGSNQHCKLDDPATLLQEKHKKPRRKVTKSKKGLKRPEKDLQIGAKLATAVKQIKKCMARQMCTQVEDEVESRSQEGSYANCTHANSSGQTQCPCDCSCRQAQIPQQTPNVVTKCKKMKKGCIDTQKYFTKRSCENPKPAPVVQSVLGPCNCPSPTETKAFKKFLQCPKFPISNLASKGDTAEATNLYFASKAILKAKEDKRKVLKTLANIRIERRIVCPDSLNQFKLSSILEDKKFERMKAKIQAEFRLAKEMETYDDMVQDPDYPNNSYSPNRAHKGQGEGPVQPSFRVMQLRMQKLKSNRKQEAENVADRARLRKALCARMIKEIPCQIYEDLMDTALQKAMTICGKEAELADFMIDTHQEKSMFYNHMKYEEGALQRLRCVQEDNLALNRQRECDLQRTVANTAARHSHRMTYETLIARQEAEAVKNKKIVQEILNTTVDLVTKICQYRSATGSDPPKGLLQEWRLSMFLQDSGGPAIQDRSGAEVDMLDQLRLNDYLLYQGEWHIDLGSENPPVLDNEVLKKIVNNLMETLYPIPKTAKARKLPLQNTGAFALCGVEFIWKKAIVTELLETALPDYQFEVVDTATTIRDAILLYAGSLEQPTLSNLLDTRESETIQEISNSQEPEVHEEGIDEINPNPDRILPGEEGDGNTVEEVKRDSKTKSEGANEIATDLAGKHKRKSTEKKHKSIDGNIKKSKKGKRASRTSGQLENEILRAQSKMVGSMDKKSTTPENSLHGDNGSKENSRKASVKEGKRDKKKAKDIELAVQPVQANPEGPPANPEGSVEESPTTNLVAETLLYSQPEHEPDEPDPSTVKSMETGAWEEFRNLGKIALEQLLHGKQVDDEITGRILAEKMRHCQPGAIIVILNYPNALCQALHLENSIKDISIDIPLCYHHVDSLIERYRQSWSEEAGDLLTLALRHAAHGGKNRSEFFNKTDMRKCDVRKKSAAFHSFLDGLLIADVTFNDKLAEIVKEEVEVEEDMAQAGNAPQTKTKFEAVSDRAEVLLHTAFLHLKRFYLQEQVAVVVPMNSDEDEYYATMAYVVQKTLAKRKQVGSKIRTSQSLEPTTTSDHPAVPPSPSAADEETHTGLEHKKSSGIAIKDASEVLSPATSVHVHNVNSDATGTVGGTGKTKSKKGKPAKGEEALPAITLTVAPKLSGGLDEGEEGGHDTPKTQAPRKSLKKRNRQSDTSEGREQVLHGIAHVGSSMEAHSEDHLLNPKEVEELEWADHDEEETAQDRMSKTEQVAKDQKSHHSKGSRYQSIISHIPKDSLQGLGDFWMSLEETFLTELRGILANIRQHHDMLANYAADFRDQFRELLERPDDRIALVAEFQVEFNEIIDDVREDVDVKTELHARVDELLERLEAISEEKYASSKDEIFKTLSDGFLEGETEIMVDFFVSLIREETDRFCDTIQFINDFYKMSGLGMPDSIPWEELAEVDLLVDLNSVKKRQTEFDGKRVGDTSTKEPSLAGGGPGSYTSLPKPLSEKGDIADEIMIVVPVDVKEEDKLPKNFRGKSRRFSKSNDVSQNAQKDVLVSKDAAPRESETVEEREIELYGTEDQAGLNTDELPFPTSRSICATPSTAMSWEFDVFNPDAYYDDEDINIDDSDFYEDELTLDQISFSEDGDVDSWPDAGTFFDATEEEYTTTSSSSAPNTRDRRHRDVRDVEIAIKEDLHDNDEEEGEDEQQNPAEEQDCVDESSGEERQAVVAVPPAPQKRPTASSNSSTDSPRKLSPQGSSSSLPESFILGDSFCDDSPPLSAVSSGASCLQNSTEDLRKGNFKSLAGQPNEETALSSCSSSGSGQSCESDPEEEMEDKRTPSEKYRDDLEEEEGHGGSEEEEEELKNLIRIEEAADTNSAEIAKVDIQGVAIDFDQEEGEENADGNRSEVFIESDGGNDYEDEAGEDFDFLEPHWKFKPKRTFMDLILDSLDEAWCHFDTVVDVSKKNVLKIEDFMKDSIRKGSPESPKVAGSGGSEVLQSLTKIISPTKKKGKKLKSKSMTHHVEHEKSQAAVTSPNLLKLAESPQKHVKGSKRFADWEKSITAETNRIKYQVAIIQARAVKELKQLKDIIVQVVSDAKVDASNFYIDELQSAFMACEVFRFAIENETGVQAKIVIEKDRFSIEPDTWFNMPSPLPPLPLLPPSPSPEVVEAASPGKLSDEEDDDEEEEAGSQTALKVSSSPRMQMTAQSALPDPNDEEEDNDEE